MSAIGIYGAKGRMGKELIECLKTEKDLKLGYAFHKNDDFNTLFEKTELIIDFSSPAGTSKLLDYAKNKPKALIIGTTGLDEALFMQMKNLSKTMPIFYASNMSLGIAVLNHLATQAAILLKDFDIEILEMHHRHKKDAPSGTALSLAQNLANSRKLDLNKLRISARDGFIGQRKKDEIGVMSLRGGDIIGRHIIGFYEDGEYLELTHNATSRATFAKGALKIAAWLKNQKAAFYTMNDFLGL